MMMMMVLMIQVDEYSVRYPLNDHNKDVLFPTGFYRCSGMGDRVYDRDSYGDRDTYDDDDDDV